MEVESLVSKAVVAGYKNSHQATQEWGEAEDRRLTAGQDPTIKDMLGPATSLHALKYFLYCVTHSRNTKHISKHVMKWGGEAAIQGKSKFNSNVCVRQHRCSGHTFGQYR